MVASFPGSTDYGSASSSTTFTVTPPLPTPTVNVSDSGGTFNGHLSGHSDRCRNKRIGASLEGVTPTLTYYSGYSVSGSGTSTAPIQAGTYTVVASFPGSTDFGSASSQTSFTITQATPLVSASDSGGAFNGSAFAATASVSGVVSGVDNSFAASLESVSPTLTYYSGSSVSGSGTSDRSGPGRHVYGGRILCRQPRLHQRELLANDLHRHQGHADDHGNGCRRNL